MADGIDVTPGSGKTVYTDETASGHVQVVRLGTGADGDTTFAPIDAVTGVLVRLSGAAAAIPISDNGGAITVDGTVAVTDGSGSLTVDDGGTSLTVDGTVTVQDGGGSLSIDDGGGSLTVDGAVTVSGTVAVTDGSGTLTVDDGGTTLSVDDGGGALTVDGTVAVSAVTDTPAAARDTDSMAVAIQSDAIMVDLSPKTPKFAAIAASSSGDNEIVALVSAKKIRVLSGWWMAAGTVNAKWQSSTAGDKTGLSYLLANVGVVLPFNPAGWFETASGEALQLNLSAAIAVGGCITYIEV